MITGTSGRQPYDMPNGTTIMNRNTAASHGYRQSILNRNFMPTPEKDSRECRVFYGNSMAIRLGCIYAHQYVFCNRGVNGIEGTLSAAAGLSIYLSEYHHPDAKKQQKVFCILGDLSFFYDHEMPSGTREAQRLSHIIVLNNGGGAIFGKFKGLKESAARENLVMAEHQTSAVNICQANDIASGSGQI